jgi:ribulose-5-phosphate 4-epimerase/fuculose-1-phosphate aldolase
MGATIQPAWTPSETGLSEAQARGDLAAAFRLAVRENLHEGVCNHFSVALGGGLFLLNPYGRHWSEITASSLLTLDVSGRVTAGEGAYEATAFHIHSRIHLAHPAAVCVLHTHMPFTTALAITVPGRLEMVEQNALRFHDDIAYDDNYGGLVLDDREGDRLARVIGDKRVLFLANHGVIVVGPSVAQAFDALYYLERAARLQVMARATGQPFRAIPAEVVEATRVRMRQDEASSAGAHFAALKRILGRDEPDYAA